MGTPSNGIVRAREEELPLFAAALVTALPAILHFQLAEHSWHLLSSKMAHKNQKPVPGTWRKSAGNGPAKVGHCCRLRVGCLLRLSLVLLFQQCQTLMRRSVAVAGRFGLDLEVDRLPLRQIYYHASGNFLGSGQAEDLRKFRRSETFDRPNFPTLNLRFRG